LENGIYILGINIFGGKTQKINLNIDRSYIEPSKEQLNGLPVKI